MPLSCPRLSETDITEKWTVTYKEPKLAGFQNKSVSYSKSLHSAESEKASGQRSDPILGNQFIPVFPQLSWF